MQSRRRAYFFVPLFIAMCALTASFLLAQAPLVKNPVAAAPKLSEDADRDQKMVMGSVALIVVPLSVMEVA